MRRIITLSVCIFLVLNLSKKLAAQTATSIAQGDWDETTTWNTGTIPDQYTNVIIRHTVSIPSGFAAEASDVTVDNSEGRDVRLKLVGSSARSLHVYGDLTLSATTAYECYMEISYEPNTVQVDGNVYMNKDLIGDVDYGPRLRLNAGHMTINGDLDIMIGNGEGANSVILMHGDAGHGGLAPTIDILGTFRYSTSSNNSSVGLNLNNSAVLTCEYADFDLAGDEASNRDFNVLLTDDAQFIINQDASITRNGGNKFYVRVGQAGDNAVFSVGGNLTLDHLGGEDVSGDELEVEINGTGTFYVGGDLAANSDSERALSIVANDNSSVAFDGDVSLTGSSDNILFEFNDGSSVEFGGEISMDFPDGTDFSDIIEFNDDSEVSFDNGNSITIIPAGINFTNLTVDTQFGMQLSSDIIVDGSVNFLKGKLDAQGNTISITNPASASITRDDLENTYPSYVYNGRVRREMLTSDAGDYIFPVGDDVSGYSPVVLNSLEGTDAQFEVEYVKMNPALDGMGTASVNLSGGLKQVSTLEYWDIHKVTSDPDNTIGAVVTLTLNDNSSETGDLDDIGPTGALKVAHWRTDIEKWENLGGNYDFDSKSITSASVQYSFSAFTVAADEEDVGLPVELVHFSAETINKGTAVQIEWETSSESNNDYFMIEKSDDGNEYYSIAEILGSGTSNTPRQYYYIDQDISNSKIYYRLKQVDYDGAYEYSDAIVISVEMHETKSMYIFPNPARSHVNILLKNETSSGNLILTNIQGQEVLRSDNVVGDKITVDLNGLPSGLYMLKLVSTDAVQTGRVIRK
jgi:hypothetical protein